MKLLDRMEAWIRPLAIPNVISGIIALQVILFLLIQTNPDFAQACIMDAQQVLQGQVWRLFSFLILPPLGMPVIFLFFHWYLLYLMGTALEQQWGAARFNLFLLVGYVANLAVAFVIPAAGATNLFLYGTIFLAFAQLYPEFTLMLFFVLPIQIKWLARLTWVLYAWQFATGSNLGRLQILASVCNFLLFFGSDIYLHLKGRQRKIRNKILTAQEASTPRNTCAVCGLNNLQDPRAEFRYCSKCSGDLCYCLEHLKSHEHVISDSRPLARD